MSILKLKIFSDGTFPFGFFFWELLARVGRDHSTTVQSSVTQVGFKRWPRDKMAFRHWVLFTRRKLSGHFFPACWYRILTSSENLWQNQTRVKSICCGGGLKQLTWPIFLKEKAFAICGLSGSFYPFSDHANHKETGWQTWGLGLDIDKSWLDPHRENFRSWSLSTKTVLFRTTFTRTIKLNLLMKWPLLGSNLSQT